MALLDDQRVQFENALIALLEGLGTSGVGTGGTILPARLTIINYVKAKLDELVPEGEGITFSLATVPNITNPLDLLINAHLDECTKDIILSAPLSVLVPTAATAIGVAYTDTKTGYVALPANFLRLSSFKMTDWNRPISIPITPEDTKYKRQFHAATRGGVNKPVAVLTWKNISTVLTRVLEYFSVESLNTVDHLFYIPETLAENFVVVNPNLLDSLAWQCAGKIMQIIEKVDLSKVAQERVTQSYNNI